MTHDDGDDDDDANDDHGDRNDVYLKSTGNIIVMRTFAPNLIDRCLKNLYSLNNT